VLQGMTRLEITWIAKVCMPYFVIMVLCLWLLWLFPSIVNWLPAQM